MKKKTPDVDADEMLPEYNFRGGVRGKFFQQYVAGIGKLPVLLDPDVARAFPNSEAANRALRSLMEPDTT